MAPLSPAALRREVEARAREPLECVGVAVRLAGEVQALLDELVERYVSEARAAGHSWSEIGAALGVSKQAAQQRFAGARVDGWPPGFREDAQRALAAASEHARRLGHAYLGTEHVLLALAGQRESLAGRVLADAGVELAGVGDALERMAGRGATTDAPIGVSPRLKRALEAAPREGRRLGHRCPGAEHLLLVLASDADSAAGRILAELGVPPARLAEALAARVGPDAAELTARLTPRRRRLRR